MPGMKGLQPGLYLPFGKSQNEKKTVDELPSSYLQWLLEQDWFEKKYERFIEPIEAELDWRTTMDRHFEDD
uniref:Quorum-sensing-regulated virulence factor n=1 Tax=viral metagenome TaxID=1070528 RepID=A0A6M3M5R2_9ZZZZ